MKVFDLAAALRGEPVWHIGQECLVENLTKVGDNVVFTIPHLGNGVYFTKLDGVSRFQDIPALAMAPKSRTIYINIWDSPSFRYTTYESQLAAMESSRVSPNSHKAYKKLNPEPIAITIEE